MKTTLEVDELLLKQVKKILGTETIRETVEQSLRAVVRHKALQELADAAGTIPLTLTVEGLTKQRKRRTPHASR